MRAEGPQSPSPPSPGRLSCTRTLYPVFGFRFINVTFSLGSTGEGGEMCHTCLGPKHVLKPPLSLSPLFFLYYPLSPFCSHPIPHYHTAPQPLTLSPLTHNGRPGNHAVLGPVVQADRGDGSIPTKGDQWGDHKLTALLGQEPRCSQRHWGYCQKNWDE